MNRLGSREFWVPGWRQGLVSALIVLLGLGTWAFAKAVFQPVGEDYGLAFPIVMVMNTGVPLYALLVLACGYLAPRGFYLWGIAVVFSHPFASLAQAASLQSRGFEIVQGGAVGWIKYASFLVMLTLVTAVSITVMSAAGAGLRLLLDHLRHGRPGTSRDVRA